MAAAVESQAQRGIDLATLSSQQLMSIKKSLDEEVEYFNSSYTSLRAAQAKFSDCLRSITETKKRKEGAQILVPLTNSLYAQGELADVSTFIVDIGTGFYVEKSGDEADDFYKRKVKELDKNLKEVEGILQGKTNNLRVVEEVLRHKVLESQQGTSSDSQQS